MRCPACPSRPELHRMDPHLMRAPLRHCETCDGLLAAAEAAVMAGSYYQPGHPVMSEARDRPSCRKCARPFEGPESKCPDCGSAQLLDCPGCAHAMKPIEVAGVTVDFCKECRLVWFDRGELGALTRHHASMLQERIARDGEPESNPSGFAVGGSAWLPELVGSILQRFV